MAGEGSGGGCSTPDDNPSQKNRIKFLCSHGGKILPRPADGHLKYVGGETRVIAVPQDITFSELDKRLSDMIEGDNMTIKYQLASEDLDTLVSVRNDDDLKHMLHEIDHQDTEGYPKLRTFLFPSKPIIVIDNNPSALMEPHSIEQRYIDAVNGVVRTTRRPKFASSVIHTPTFTISSTCSSPHSNSPEHQGIESVVPVVAGPEILLNGYQRSGNMHRVHSSPTLYRSNSPQRNNNVPRPQAYHYGPPHQNYHGCQSSKLLGWDLQKAAATDRMVPAVSMARGEFRRGVLGHGVDHQYHYANRHHRGTGGGGAYDDFLSYESGLSDKDVKRLCSKYAELEKSMGETDRDGSIFSLHLIQIHHLMGFPGRNNHFEVQNGNEDPFREILEVSLLCHSQLAYAAKAILTPKMAMVKWDSSFMRVGIQSHTEDGIDVLDAVLENWLIKWKKLKIRLRTLMMKQSCFALEKLKRSDCSKITIGQFKGRVLGGKLVVTV
ncbi:hypothetical protein F8388_013480 [Cannabis sativa]|uniref:PB1 domain-containing protein n=1 Tax=Cannabis sativa TaxID=3483 RepID=A0A7J6G8Y6_CANSA|nr:hypothetical protein F8388_013480 [Cannabis sativa]